MTADDTLDRLTLVAMEAIRVQLAPLTAAIIENTRQWAAGDRSAAPLFPGPKEIRERGEDQSGTPPAVALAGLAARGGIAGLLRDLLAEVRSGQLPNQAGGVQPPAADKDKKDEAGTPRLLALLRAPFADLARLLAPMAGMAAVIGSNASGFQVVASAMKVMAATLAPLLLPAFVLIAAAIVAVADLIWDNVAGGLEAFYTFVLRNVIPVIESVAKFFGQLATFVSSTLIPGLREFASKLGEIVKWVMDKVGITDPNDQAAAAGTGAGVLAGAAVGYRRAGWRGALVGGAVGGLAGFGIGESVGGGTGGGDGGDGGPGDSGMLGGALTGGFLGYRRAGWKGALVGAGAGALLGKGLDEVADSRWGAAGSGALTGAGIGSLIPLPGATLAGAGIGGIAGYFGGEEQQKLGPTRTTRLVPAEPPAAGPPPDFAAQMARAKELGDDWKKRFEGLWQGGHEQPTKPGGAPAAGGGIAGAVTGAARGGLSDRFATALNETMQELRQSLLPKATISSLTDVTKQAQLAALNQSPFEAKILGRLSDILTALQGAVSRVAPRPEPTAFGQRGGGSG